ncbi:hypothetical protein MMC30_004627 [Trapelia coarctata]|nr:hypothetical protein [Trapelia coarctata]
MPQNRKVLSILGDSIALMYLQSRARTGLAFHLRTLWLFTCNDIKSIVGPETAFGICGALSGPLMTANESPHFLTIIIRLPQVSIWLWLNLLLFTVSNQSLPGSVKEDAINKPWRPIASERIGLQQARRLLLAVIPTVFFVTLYLGAVEVSVALMVFTWMYNDLGGADDNFFIRNLLNLFGFVCYSLGAIMIASDSRQHPLNCTAYQWLAIVGLVVLTSLQMQDLPDQEGDQARGRKTVPLILGDWMARWTVAVPVAIWSILCPLFWKLTMYGFLVPVAMGGAIVLRVILKRSVAADKVTWKLWCLWTISLYALPLYKNYKVVF